MTIVRRARRCAGTPGESAWARTESNSNARALGRPARADESIRRTCAREDEHADENFEQTDDFKRGEADEDMEVDEGVTKKESKNIVAECDEIGALRPRRIN